MPKRSILPEDLLEALKDQQVLGVLKEQLISCLTPLIESIVIKMTDAIKHTLEEMIMQRIDDRFSALNVPDETMIEQKAKEGISALNESIDDKTASIKKLEATIKERDRTIEELDKQERSRSLVI